MNPLIFSINAVFPLILVAAFGFFARKNNTLTDEFLKVGNKFCFKYGFFFMMFTTIYDIESFDDINWYVILFAVVGVLLLFFIAILFDIALPPIVSEAIMEVITSPTQNIFKFKLNESGERVSQIPYVNSVFIKRKLPGRIEINVTESIPMGYISYNDKLLVVDKDGKVLEAKNEKINYQIPILSDFKVSQFTLGKKINEKDEEKLKKTLEIAKNLYNNNLIDKIVSITSQKDDFYLIVNDNLKIVIGDTENLSGKLVMLKEVLNKLPEDATGIIDARNADKVYHRT